MYKEILPVMIIALMFAIAYYAESRVLTNSNGEIASHWGLGGKVDGWMSRTVGVYLVPVLALILYIVLLIIPKIEVYQKNLEDFSQQYWGFKVILVFVMGVIYVTTLLPNLGYWGKADSSFVMLVIISAVALLFFYVGYMLNFTKRNYFIGIRTPWTLADEKIWEKTNHLASRLFWVCGVLTLVSLVTPSDLRVWLILLPVVLAAIGASLYSLWEYRKTKKAHSKIKESRKPGKKR